MPSQESESTLPFNIFITLSLISLAALFVKVTQSIWLGQAFFCLTMYANFEVKTFVFPEPAPATTNVGPLIFRTADFCLSFNSSRKFLFSFIVINFIFTLYWI